MESKPNVYAFIDGTNLHRSVEEQGWKLNYRRFRKYLARRFDVNKAFYFIGYVPSQRNLYESLRRSGYKLKFKPISINKEGEIKGNVDAELILTAILKFHQYKQAIIVAGDGDYYCLIKYLKRHQKLLKVVVPDRNSYSWLLRRFAPDMIFISKLRRKLEYKPNKK